MRSGRMLASLAALGGMLVVGCGGDIGTMIEKNTAMRERVMNAIASNTDLAGSMTDQLLAGDSTRTLVIDRLMSNGAAKQQIMTSIAHDETMVDGVIAFAVQDTAMRAHILALLKGVQMAGSK